MSEEETSDAPKYSRETIDLLVAAYETKTIKEIAVETGISVLSIRYILAREGKYGYRISISDIATPVEWLRRVRSIPDHRMRNWVGSLIYWDYDEDKSYLLFREFANNYDSNNDLSEHNFLANLKSIGYPEIEKRINSKVNEV